MKDEQDIGIYGKTMREYLDAAEVPVVVLVSLVSFGYVASYWLNVSYLALAAPLTLIFGCLAAVVVGYLRGVLGGFSLFQVAITCFFVGFATGIATAAWSLVRFLYPWLVLNLIAEPVWAGLLMAAVGSATVGFFRLPEAVRRIVGAVQKPHV